MKTKLLLALGATILLTGCGERTVDKSKELKPDVTEFCYDGTTYIKFGYGKYSYGAAKQPLEECNYQP